MLTSLSMAAGAALLLWTTYDVFVTVFVLGGGAGPQSGRLASVLWRGALRLHRPASRRSHSVLRAAGPSIVLLVLLVWVAELILGWALVFAPLAFQATSVSFGDQVVFAASTVIGRGGNSPSLATATGGWELVHGVAGLSGVALISLGLAYVLPILGGVAQKRSVAAHIRCIGSDAPEMRDLVARSGGGQVDLHLIALVAPLTVSAERHRSYPVLHYFHSGEPHAALAPAIASLSLFLEGGVEGAPDIDASVTEPLARAVQDLLDAVAVMGLEQFADGLEAHDDLDALGLGPRRSEAGGLPSPAWLEAYVRYDGWSWSELAR